MARSPTSLLDREARTGSHSQALEVLGRAGLMAKGAIYTIVGLLSVELARSGSPGAEPSATGAIETVARQPWGQSLLLLLTAGLIALSGWRAVGAVLGDPVEGSDAPDRLRYGAKALIYLSAASTAASILLSNWGETVGSGSEGGDEARADSLTAAALGWPAGRWLVGIAGLALVAGGLHVLHRRVVKAEMARWLDSGADAGVRTAVILAGRAGYGAWAATAVLIAVFLLQAALTGDPSEAVGVSGALRSLGDSWWGQLILYAIAAGLVLLGGFHLAMSRYRRM